MTGPELDNRRVAAAIVDLALVGAVIAVLAALAGGLTASVEAVGAGWALYYYFAFESAAGQTLGKKLLGLRVTDQRGEQPALAQIAMRTLLRLVDGIGLYLVGLVVMLATGKRRQRLGDVVAHTVVTTADAGPAAAAEPNDESPEDEEQAPEEPAPVDATPEEPVLVEPAPEQPAFVASAPVEPVPVEPVPVEPVHEEPAPVELGLEESPSEDSPVEESPAAAPEDEQPVVPVKRMEIVSPIELIMGAADEPKAEGEDDPGDSRDGEQPAL